MGERMPIWDCTARGVMFGLSLLHTRGHVIRALMEARGTVSTTSSSGRRTTGLPRAKPTAMVEGGARSPLWRQIISDVCGVDTVVHGRAHRALRLATR